MRYILYNDAPIDLKNATVSSDDLLSAASKANEILLGVEVNRNASMPSFYDVIDARSLSGFVGELYARVLAGQHGTLKSNPHIDGYPDLLDVSTPEALASAASTDSAVFNEFAFGGLEVKNTFGNLRQPYKPKKLPSGPPPQYDYRATRDARLSGLVWKAHHQRTNHLVALQADYIDRVPQVVAMFFSSELCEDDWSVKQNPTEESAMTSFCATKPSAYAKLRAGLRFYADSNVLAKFLSV